MRIKYEIFRGKNVTHHFFRGKRYPLAVKPIYIPKYGRAVSGSLHRHFAGVFKGPSQTGGRAVSGAAVAVTNETLITTAAEWANARGGGGAGAVANPSMNALIYAEARSGLALKNAVRPFVGGSVFASAVAENPTGQYAVPHRETTPLFARSVGGEAAGSASAPFTGGAAVGSADSGESSGARAETYVESEAHPYIAEGTYRFASPSYFPEVAFNFNMEFTMTVGGITYDRHSIIIGDDGVTGVNMKAVPASTVYLHVAYRNESTGNAWVVNSPTKTVKGTTPVDLADYGAFNQMFTRVTE